MLKDLLLFALLPACCGALAVAATLALPGDAATASPRALFSVCLINGIAAFTLPGVIQVWFTMGETKRANQAEERADRERDLAIAERELAIAERERANQERELARQSAAELAETRVKMAELQSEVSDLRRLLDERASVNGSTPD